MVKGSRHGRKRTALAPRLPADLNAAFDAGGEMGRLIRLFNWADTPLGPIKDWPQSLRTAVSLCVQSSEPLSVAWGPRLTYLYNDEMRRLLGPLHPHALGLPKPEMCGSLWREVGPLHAAVLARGVGLAATEQVQLVDRQGRVEEMHLHSSHTPLRDESGEVVGILTAAADVTRQTVAQRRLHVLQELTRVPARARSLQEACGLVTSGIAGDRGDIWFAMVYILLGDSRSAVLAGCSGLPAATPLSSLRVDLRSESEPWAIGQVAAGGLPRESPTPAPQLMQLREWPPGGAPVTALTVPIAPDPAMGPGMSLVLGISPIIPRDAEVSFFELLSEQAARVLAAVGASEAAAEGNASTAAGLGGQPEISEEAREASVRAAERQRLARDVHDSLIPTLYGIALGAERLTELAQDETAREVARYVRELAGSALGEVRALIFELRPEPLERGGLGMALRELAAVVEARQPVQVTVRIDQEPDCSRWVREAIYRIAQEALANVVRHAHATSVTLDLRREGDLLALQVVDNGVGFDADLGEPGHLGRELMRERAVVLGGSLEVMSQPHGGTTVRAVIPCEGRPPASH